MINKYLCATLFALSSLNTVAQTDIPEPVFHHTFDSLKDVSGRYEAMLKSGAELQSVSGEGIVWLGKRNGYFDFSSAMGEVISSLEADYTVSLNVFIPETTALGSNGNFIFNFGNSSSAGYMFFGANESRFSITRTNYSAEQTVSARRQFPKGEWKNLVYVQKGTSGYVYIDGVEQGSGNVRLLPSRLGATKQNWLGRSPYNGDVALKDAKYSDFRIYDTALTPENINVLCNDEGLLMLNADIYQKKIDAFVSEWDVDFSDVRTDIDFPSVVGDGINVSWTSTDEALISADGKVVRPAVGQQDAELKLIATLTKGKATSQKVFDAVVKAQMNDADGAEYDLSKLQINAYLPNLRKDMILPTTATEGSLITWQSSDETYITNDGKLQKLSPVGAGKAEVTLTATATKGEAVATRNFTVYVAEDEGYSSYLFVYFPSNSNEHLYYALGTDGYNFRPLNDGKRVMSSDTVALKKGIRDPHILRGQDGKTFYMVATDMKSAEGWSSNRGIVMYKSTDLVHWTHSTVHFPTRFPEWKNVTRVWAPEVIWDPDYENIDGTKGRYLVYFSLLTNDGKCTYDKIHYCYANDDFTDLMTDPVYFYDRGSATIDGDIVYNPHDSLYHMVYKNEGSGGICQVTARRLTPEPGQPDGSQWSEPSGTLQQTNVAVEGAGMYRLINTDTWILMYDCYSNGYYQFCSSEDLVNFKLEAQTNTSGAFTPRHGTVLPITPEETARLLKAFPYDSSTAIEDLPSVSEITKSYYISVNGTILGTSLPEHSGIYLQKNIHQDGTTRVVKILKR